MTIKKKLKKKYMVISYKGFRRWSYCLTYQAWLDSKNQTKILKEQSNELLKKNDTLDNIRKSVKGVLDENLIEKDRIKSRNSFSYIIILNLLGIKLPEESGPIIDYAFSMFSLSLIGLLCFLNIVGYLTTILIINNKIFENKIESRPFIKKMVEYYKKSSLIYVGIEIILCLVIFIFLIINSLIVLGAILKKKQFILL